MIRSKYLSLIVVAAALAAGACSKTASNNTNTNSNAAPTNANANSVQPANTASAKDAGDPAGSPSEVYKMAHIARQKKDIETLKKIFSKDILDFFTEVGKSENKTLDDELREMCQKAPSGDAEVRNEKINGDKATVEYKEDGTWKTMDFVKEDGTWKMTIPKGDPDKDKDKKDNNRS